MISVGDLRFANVALHDRWRDLRGISGISVVLATRKEQSANAERHPSVLLVSAYTPTQK
jgi:hypothetical protein